MSGASSGPLAMTAARAPVQVNVPAIAVCCLAAFLDGADSQSIAIAAPLIARELRLGVGQLGLLFSLAALGAALGAMICGPLADRWGPKRVLVLCLTWFGILSLLTAATRSYTDLVAVRVLMGLGLGGATPCFLTLGASHAPVRARARTLGLIWAGFPLGGFAGGFTNGYILTHLGWRDVFAVGGILPLATALVILVGVSEAPSFMARASPCQPLLDAERAAPSPRLIAALLGNRSLALSALLLWAIFFSVFGILAGAVVWMPSMAVTAGLTPGQGAMIVSWHALGALISIASAGYLLDRLGPSLLTIGLAVGAASLAATGLLMSSFAGVVAGMLAAGVFLGAAASGAIALAERVFPARLQASGMGWSMGWGRVGQVLTPAMMGAGLAWRLSVTTVLIASALVPLAAAGAAALLAPRVRRTARSGE